MKFMQNFLHLAERLSSTYEIEPKELNDSIAKAEQGSENAEQENVGLKVFCKQ